jgi:dihydroorotate dehydrogenase
MKREIDGIVVANTTTARVGLKSKNQSESGGLSGKPLFERTFGLVCRVKRLAPKLTVIASGGIFDAEEAWCLLNQAKADLLQIYTALVYEGPGVVREINSGILKRIRKGNYYSIENVG